MAKYLVAGSLTVDYIATLDEAIHERILGGGLAYSAVGARIWSDSVGMIGRVGPTFPEDLLQPCQAHSIEIDGLRQTDLAGSPERFFAYEEPSVRLDTKPASWYVKAGRPLPKELLPLQRPEATPGTGRPDPLPADLPSNSDECKGVHLASVHWRNASLLGARLVSLGVPIITLDPSREVMSAGDRERLRLLLHDVDAFLPSVRQSRDFFRPERPKVEEMAEAFGAMGPTIVVIKRGERGQHLYDRDRGQHWRIPAYPTQVSDVTGAGHAYCGAFLVGLVETGDPIEAALRGGVSSSLAIEGTGPFYALDALPGLPAARLYALRESLGRV